MSTRHPLDACRAARLPIAGLTALAPLRATGGVYVIPGDPAWVTWESPRPDVVAALLAVSGAELFEPRDGRWHRPAELLPAFDVPPAGSPIPLDGVVVPEPLTPTGPGERELRRISLRLVRSDVPRPATALRCSIGALQQWADGAPTAEIAAIKAARCDDTAWLLGSMLPALAGAERFWGDRVFIPLGLRAEPDWPETAVRESAGVGPDELLMLTDDAIEAIPQDAFRLLTRGAIRRANRL